MEFVQGEIYIYITVLALIISLICNFASIINFLYKKFRWVCGKFGRGKDRFNLRYYLKEKREIYFNQYDPNSGTSWLEVSVNGRRYDSLFHVLDLCFEPNVEKWGQVVYTGEYSYPTLLEPHKKSMGKDFSEAGLFKHDGVCPRISDFKKESDSSPVYYIQLAHYLDQIGSNLSLDYNYQEYPLSMADGKAQLLDDRSNPLESRTVREWDKIQAKKEYNQLPSLRESKLANTIGVAIGITGKSRFGKKKMLYQLRNNKVMIYQDEWHLGSSFAQPMKADCARNQYISLYEFLYDGIQKCFEKETNLDLESDGKLVLLAFCRDILRGGKPQFFFEYELNKPINEYHKKIQENSKSPRKKGFPKNNMLNAIVQYKRKKWQACKPLQKRSAFGAFWLCNYSEELVAFSILEYLKRQQVNSI